jgi:GNAT superfamily N-acetyltransferase
MPEPRLSLRPADARDIPELERIWREAAYGVSLPSPAPEPVWLAHELATGTALLAEADGRPVGFGVLLTRGPVSNLAELFVRPTAQSKGAGGALLDALLAGAAEDCFTVAAGDPRAIALYARRGLLPRWPFYYLSGESSALALPRSTVTAVPAEWDDPAFVGADLRCSGRPRGADAAYLRAERAARPLWFRRGAATIGYGCVQTRVEEFTVVPETAMVGPLGARDARDALASVLAAVAWARERARVIRLGLPAPHPALVPLLDSGFRIADSDTFMARGRARFCDPRIYVPSGAEFY